MRSCSCWAAFDPARSANAGARIGAAWGQSSPTSSLDEFTIIHERANSWLDLGGVFYFGWVIPMEMSGASLFLVALLRHLAGGGQTLRIIAPVTATCVAESKQIRDTHSPGEHSFASAAARFWPALFMLSVAGALRSRASSADSG